MTKTNIKNLPEGNYFTEIMYSDSHAWQEIKRTAKTVTVRRVAVDTDPEWISKRQFLPGGFHGHVPNQSEQTWIFKGFDSRIATIRLTKRGWAYKGTRFVEGLAREFHDYNL